MSDDNLDIIRRGVEAFASGDWDTALEGFVADAEWCDPPGLPGAGVHRGLAAIRARWQELDEHLTGFTVVPDRYYAAEDKVVVFLRTRGRGRTSGIVLEREIAQVYTVLGGRVTSVVGHEDHEEALLSAGLDPVELRR